MVSAMNKLVFWVCLGVILTFVLINMGVQKEVLIVLGLIALAIGGLARRMLGSYFQAIKEMKRKRHDKAIGLFKEFISEVKYNPALLKWQWFTTLSTKAYSFKETAYLNIGVCYFHKGDMKEAVSYFKKTTEVRPDLIEAYLNIAMIYFTQEKKEECYQWLEKAKLYRNPQFDKLLIEDSFFDPIRNEKRFQKLLSLDAHVSERETPPAN